MDISHSTIRGYEGMKEKLDSVDSFDLPLKTVDFAKEHRAEYVQPKVEECKDVCKDIASLDLPVGRVSI